MLLDARYAVLVVVGVVRAQEAAVTEAWEPPKCASWCRFNKGNCAKDMCSGCDSCAGMPSLPPLPAGGSTAPIGPCNAGCNVNYCNAATSPLVCTGCKFCANPNGAMCEGWCSKEHHCHDDRCTACPHCSDGVGGDVSCPQWCSDHHCKDDARCGKCTICAPPAQVLPPASAKPAGAAIDAAARDVRGVGLLTAVLPARAALARGVRDAPPALRPSVRPSVR